jgi:hypothetical protein
MVSSGMLHRMALVRTDISEELSASFIRMSRIGELGTTLALTSNRRSMCRLLVTATSQFTDFLHPDEGGAKFLRYVGSYKSHTV